MLKPVKVVVGPSPHYHELKSGQIKYQKSKPADPVWRILVIEEAKNIMHVRFFANKPSAADIDNVVFGLLADEKIRDTDIVIPASVEKLCPGLQNKLASNGAKIYVPAHGFASGSLAVKEADKFIMLLGVSLDLVRESVASCEEIAAVAGNSLGVVTVTLWREKFGDQRHKVSTTTKMAHDIARLRGRDPEAGQKMRRNESCWGPLNKRKQVPPSEDVLDTLLERVNLQEPGFGDVILLLKEIREAEPDKKLSLIRELGAVTAQYQIASLRQGRYGFISYLFSYLSDPCLRYIVLLGMKEAFNELIVLDDGLLQVAAANVEVQYPPDCTNLTLRGIPAHHRLEKMIHGISSGKIAILPILFNLNQGAVDFLPIWGPFRSLVFTDRSPLNPSQCVIPITKGGHQMKEGLLIALAILARDTTSYIPLDDHKLAANMTTLINERLSRNSIGVTCNVMPFQRGGGVMEIGQPPQELRKNMGIKLGDVDIAGV